MTKKPKDERLVQLNHQVQREAYLIAAALLAASMFIKAYLLGLPASSYATELAVLCISLVYIVVRGAVLGHTEADSPKWATKAALPASLGLGLLAALSIGLRNYSLYGERYAGPLDPYFWAAVGVAFLSSFLLAALAFWAMGAIGRAGQKRLEKQLEDSEG